MSAGELFDLVKTGDLDGMRARLAADPGLAGSLGDGGVSLLVFAAYYRRFDMVEAILAHEPVLDIFEATIAGRIERVKELLQRDPSMVGAWSPDGFTPLHYAAFFGQPALAQLLLERGAEVDVIARNPMKVTPLHSAVTAKQVETVQRLLERGADANARQQEGWTALMSTAQSGDETLADLLLARGADPTLANEAGVSSVDLARAAGHTALLAKFRAVRR